MVPARPLRLPATQLLAAAAGHAAAGGEEWCAAQFWLGVLTAGSDVTIEFRPLHARPGTRWPGARRCRCWPARWPGARETLANLGRLPEAAEEARRALAMARELGDRLGEADALFWLGAAAHYAGDYRRGCVAWLRQAQRIDRAALPGCASPG